MPGRWAGTQWSPNKSPFGTEEQKQKYLPRMATGELRATMALTEPGGGSDLQNMATVARTDGDDLVINGSKTWISNARRSGLIALLCKTDPKAQPRHRGISIVLAEHGQTLTVSAIFPEAGVQGSSRAVVVRRLPRSRVRRSWARCREGLRADDEGPGDGPYPGRFPRARCRDRGPRTHCATHRNANLSGNRSGSTSPWATIWPTWPQTDRRPAAHLACGAPLRQRRPLRYGTGMAKLFASEVAMEIALNAVRIHGGYGYSTEFDVERYFRDAPLMIVGEGTNEIQRTVIAGQLVARGGI